MFYNDSQAEYSDYNNPILDRLFAFVIQKDIDIRKNRMYDGYITL